MRELESNLSESVPRTELESAKAQAESKIRELQGKLSELETEADALRRRVRELEAAAAKRLTQEKPSGPS